MPVTTTTVLLAASVAASAAAASKQSQAQKKAANAANAEAQYGAAMTDMQAEDIKRKANEDADKILVQAAKIRSTQGAQIASSGFMLGEGTAQTVIDETTRLSTADALVVLYDGIDGKTSANSTADNMRAAGKANMEAGYAQARGTIMTGVANAISGSVGIYNKSKLTTTKGS